MLSWRLTPGEKSVSISAVAMDSWRAPFFSLFPFSFPHNGAGPIQKINSRCIKGNKNGDGQPEGSVKIDEIRKRDAGQDEEAPQEVNDVLSPFKLPLNLFQFIREEYNKEDQGDQYERKQDEIEEVIIHPFTPGGLVKDYGISFSYYGE
jgi:hypothetical protein